MGGEGHVRTNRQHTMFTIDSLDRRVQVSCVCSPLVRRGGNWVVCWQRSLVVGLFSVHGHRLFSIFFYSGFVEDKRQEGKGEGERERERERAVARQGFIMLISTLFLLGCEEGSDGVDQASPETKNQIEWTWAWHPLAPTISPLLQAKTD